jgi:hypothetical protein
MAVSQDNQMLGATPITVSMLDQYGYPATAVGLVLTGYGSPHLIWYVGNPVGLFLTTPNGSITFDSTNHHTYTKTGALGSGFAGAWVINS